VPQLYFDYLRYGRVEPLKGVFYHNAQDILSLAALTALSCSVFDDPLGSEASAAEDLYSLGRLYAQVGLGERVEVVLKAALAASIPAELRTQTICDLSFHLKRKGNWTEAIGLWQLAIEENHGRLYPFVELAKYYEHRESDYTAAEQLVLRAIDLVETSSPRRGSWWAEQRLAELEHRLRRLQSKMARDENPTG
jgi:tetratricopeptide (TPR) repeat protein